MTATVTIVTALYALGVLATPFFWSFIDGWPFVEPRCMDMGDSFMFLFVCLFWPVALTLWLMFAWWCATSWLGSRARRFANRKWADIKGWAHGA